MASDILAVKDVIFIRVDGGSEKGLGMGHVYRCLNLALFLKRYSKVIFLIKKYSEALELIKQNGLEAISMRMCEGIEDELKKIAFLIRRFKPRLFVADIRNIDDSYIKNIKHKGCFFVYFDDLGRKDLEPNLLINPDPCNIFLKYPKRDSIKYLLGPKYFILNNQRALGRKKNYRIRKAVKRVIFSFGGADPRDCLFKVIKFLNYLPDTIEYFLIVGPAYKNKNRISAYIRNNLQKNIKKIYIKDNVSDMLGEFLLSDIAVVSGGDTLLEALYIGVPAIVIPTIWYEDKIAKRFQKSGMVLKMSHVDNFKKEELLENLQRLISDYNLRVDIHKRSRNLIDNEGAKRIYSRIRRLLPAKK